MHHRRTRTIARLALIALVAATLATLAPQAAAPVAADGNEAPGAPLAFRSITAGGNHSCGILPSGAVKCWGNNSYGQLGQGSTAHLGDQTGEMAALTAIDLGAGRTATAVSAGEDHTCALLDNGTVKCWGRNDSGQLGQGSAANQGDQAGEMAALPVVNLGAGRTATAITAGDFHTCALLDNATVKCWGRNESGQLGQGSTADLGDQSGEMAALAPVNLGAGRTATAVTAGAVHTCALLDNATVKCWGYNGEGELGQGSTSTLGDQAGEMAALAPVNLGAGRTATAVTAGSTHTCAVLDNAALKCWGYNIFGQLGQGSTSTLGDQAGEMAALAAVNLGGRTAIAVTAGTYHTCASLDDGTVKCWGRGSEGQLAQGSTATLGDQAGEMAALAAVNLGAGRTATAVTAGDYHTCASLDDGTVKCWGNNNAGQLGQDSIDALGDQAGEMAALPPVFFASPALSVNMSADEVSVTVGDTVHLHVKVTNTGDVALTNVAITDANATGCQVAPFSLAVGADRSVDCTHLAAAGEVAGGYHNQASVASAEVTTPVVSSTVSVTVAAAPSPDPLVFVNRWGSFGFDDGQFQNPYGVAVDPSGHVYVADTYNNRVQVFTSAGALITKWGSAGSGEGQFSAPAALAVDGSGNVYVADHDNNRVQKFTSAGVFLASWGTAGSGAGQLSFPSGVAVGPSGDVYVADTFNQRVQQFTSAGTFVRTWGAAGSGQGQFSYPSAVAVDGAGHVYVADTFNQRVQKFSPTGAFLTTWGSGGSADGQFSYPFGLAADAGGNVYVTDNGNARVERFTASGLFVSKWGRRGAGDGQLDSPRGVAVDGAGHVFVADTNNSRVQQFAPVPPPAPALSVDATADESSVIAGDTVHLHVKVTNTGNVALTNVALSDANATECEAAPFELAVGTDHTVDCTHVAVDGDVPTYANSASVVSAEVTTPVVSNQVNVTVTAAAPALSVVVSGDEVSVTPGQVIHAHVVVSNTGNVALHNVTVSDTKVPDCANDGAFDLAADTFATIDCAYTTTGNDSGTFEHEASVTADEVTTPVVSNQIDVTVDDAVTVTMAADRDTVVVGTPVAYLITVKNTSTLQMATPTVTDQAVPDCVRDAAAAEFSPGQQTTATCTFVPTADDIGTFSNTATADSAQIVAVTSNQVDVTVVAAAPALTVTQTADETSVTAGDTVHLHLSVANTGNVALHAVTIAAPGTDCGSSPFDLSVAGAPPVKGGAPSETTIDCTHLATGTDVPTYATAATVTSTELTTPVVSNLVSVAVTIPAGSAHVAGTITEAGSGIPVAGTIAAVLSPSDFSLVAVTTADTNGHFGTVVAPGSYYLYVIDPADSHAARFHGAPTTVSATADHTTAADTALVSTRGTIAGDVTADTGGGPLANVMAISVDLDHGVPAAGDLTDNNGHFTISGLRPGPRLMEYVDLTGSHQPEFYDDVPTPAGTTIIPVIGASQATADAGLADRTAPTGGAAVAGQVTSTTGEALPGVAVFAIHTADFSLGAGTLTDAGGHYTLDLDPGDYKVAFYDPTATHGFEWNHDYGPDGLAAADTITAGDPGPVDAALTPTTGSATGTVTAAGSGTPIADIAVFAIDANGTVVAEAPTAADGTYTLTGLPAGAVRLRYVDLTATHTSTYYNGTPDYDAATPITITAGATTPGLDTTLTPNV